MRIRRSEYALVALQQSLGDTDARNIEGVGSSELSAGDTTNHSVSKCVEGSGGEADTVRVLRGGEASRGWLLKE